ncbi:MAG: hypothetical protein U0894_08740 [Pirellulales bacterium]
MIRTNRIPFLQNASWPLTMTTLLVIVKSNCVAVFAAGAGAGFYTAAAALLADYYRHDACLLGINAGG